MLGWAMRSVLAMVNSGACIKYFIVYAVSILLAASQPALAATLAPSPDLAVSAVSSPSVGAPGSKIKVYNAVSASSSGGDARGFSVGIYLSLNNTITTSSIYLGQRYVSRLS